MYIPPRWLQLAALSVVYCVAAKFGLAFAFVNASATAIWPATGVALAAFLILGYRAWPAILVGAFVANLTTQDSVAASIGIGIGNTLEALIGAWLVNHFANGRQFVKRPLHIFLFAGFGAFVSATVGATIGVTSLVLAGLAMQADAGPIWLTWWLGDAASALVMAPAIVLWSNDFRMDWEFRRSVEAGILVGCLAFVAFSIFHGITPVGSGDLPLQFLWTPFLFWAAFRFGRRAVATCVLLVSWISLWGTVRGFGPFIQSSLNESLLVLQAHLAVEAVTMLAVGAVVWQLRQSEVNARQLSVTDSLTGLSNYRRLMISLPDEIKRSQRTGLPLAVLLLDLDGLKLLNDGHGHLAGNRALCRVADALRGSVRSTDTVVRFGGDEFACVLPDTSDSGAEDLANRLRDRLASDLEQPGLSVSVGWAVYPRDGASAELLLSAADRALYAAKTSRSAQVLVAALGRGVRELFER